MSMVIMSMVIISYEITSFFTVQSNILYDINNDNNIMILILCFETRSIFIKHKYIVNIYYKILSMNNLFPVMSSFMIDDSLVSH